MAVGDGVAFERAMGDLLLQVSRDNVLAVHRAFKDQADNLRLRLRRFENETEVGFCGGDPISRDAQAAFTGKIGELLSVHWAHWEELDAVSDRLRAVARSYGMTETEIAASFDDR